MVAVSAELGACLSSVSCWPTVAVSVELGTCLSSVSCWPMVAVSVELGTIFAIWQVEQQSTCYNIVKNFYCWMF